MSLKDSSAGILGSLIKGRREHGGGFTLVELLIVIAILGTLSGIAIPLYNYQIEKARIIRAIAEIRILEKEITLYEIDSRDLPDKLEDIVRKGFLDPWGKKYKYLNFANVKGKGKMRKDRFLVPLNSDFDLCSKGRDGKTKPNLAAKVSYDDIIRANDGEYVGIASEY